MLRSAEVLRPACDAGRVRERTSCRAKLARAPSAGCSRIGARVPCLPKATKITTFQLGRTAGRQRGMQAARASDSEGETGAPDVAAAPSTTEATSKASTGAGPWYSLAGGLAAVGALETAYLTFTKLTGSSVACGLTGEGCSQVLSSDYAEIFGVPLPLLGCLVYSAVAFTALQGAQTVAEGGNDEVQQMGLRGGATILAAVSTYLMYTLFTQLDGTPCPYCFASAALSACILVASLPGAKTSDLPKGLGLGGSVVVAMGLLFSGVSAPPPAANAAAADLVLERKYPEIEKSSDPRVVALAEHLTTTGAKMYGAFWCSHCNDQKAAFGKEAVKVMPYVECFPDGFTRTTIDGKTETTKMEGACTEAGVKAFPSWVINGKLIEGELSFRELAQYSNFKIPEKQ